jgi:PAS domain S-box-containing protein
MKFISRIRENFAASVLGTTSPTLPDLSGGLPIATRAIVVLLALALATAFAFAIAPVGGPFGSLFFFPAVMLAGLMGGVELCAGALAVAVLLTAAFFTRGTETLFFIVAATLQAGLALGLRQLFRESRRWGVRYRRLLGAISSCVIVSDMDGQIRYPQPDFERLIGMKWPDYAGMGWIAAVHPDDLMISSGEPGVRNNVLRRTVRLRNPESGDWRWFQFRSIPIPGQGGRPQELVSVLMDVHERKLGQQEHELVQGEVRHRWKNLMTVINALATSSQPEAAGPEIKQYVERFQGRLRALAAAGDEALAAGREAPVDTGMVIRATLAPFIEEPSPRIRLSGPPCLLNEATCASLALGMHELATNAIKYGALSVPDGRVDIRWRVNDADKGKQEQVLIEWSESGGPAPSTSRREGYGTRVIKFIPAREKNGSVDLNYRPEGLICRISFVRSPILTEATSLF